MLTHAQMEKRLKEKNQCHQHVWDLHENTSALPLKKKKKVGGGDSQKGDEENSDNCWRIYILF